MCSCGVSAERVAEDRPGVGKQERVAEEPSPGVPGATPAACDKVDLWSKDVVKFRKIGRPMVENGGNHDIR